MTQIISNSGFIYDLNICEQAFGDQLVKVACLDNLEPAIDQMFERLSLIGAQDLLPEYCPYFAFLWPSAIALAQELLKLHLQGQSVLELGCGLAVPSLLLGHEGHVKVSVSDQHPDTQEILNLNLKLNPKTLLNFVPLDWRKNFDLGTFDLIYASDVLYDEETSSLLSQFLINSKASKIIVADPFRPYGESFMKQLGDNGYSAQSQTKTIDTRGLSIPIRMMSFELI